MLFNPNTIEIKLIIKRANGTEEILGAVSSLLDQNDNDSTDSSST